LETRIIDGREEKRRNGKCFHFNKQRWAIW